MQLAPDDMTTTTKVLALLLAAAAATGCGGGREDDVVVPAAVADETPPEPPAAPAPTQAQPSSSGGDDTTTPPPPPSHPAALDVALGANANLVTSFATDELGNVYGAGTFELPMMVGTERLVSRGRADVFLVKVTSSGQVVWGLAVGSPDDEKGPRVTLRDGNVNLVGMTNGRLDCGDGPLPTWGSETFFMCLFGNADGATRGGGVFPTGAP